jgi:imidazolonepropionase-like amidohydrolase
MSHTTIASFALFVFATLFAVDPAPAQTVLFDGARVIPGDGSAAVENGAILVERGTITRVGRAGEIAAPAGASRIGLAGKTVMPAIVSTHVHPGFQKGLTYSAANYTRETILGDLNRELYFGISTAMSLGVEKGDVMFEMRADQAAGKLGGAQLLLAGRGIGAPNAGPGAAAYANIAYEVTTEAEIRKAVQEQAAKKVDVIKIWVDDRGGRAPRLPTALSRAAIDEGHKAGLKVIAHIFYHDDAMELAAAGINGFAHLVRDKVMSDELIALMLKNNVYQMPNIATPERGIHAGMPAWLDEPHLMGLLRDTESPEVIARVRASYSGRDPAVAARNQRGYAILQQSLARLSAAGVRIVLGSDTGLEDHFFGFAEHKELQFMTESGMTPAQVIVAATSRAAEFLGLADRGTLAAGKRADLLVLDANPLDDIRNTRRIAKLYIAGAEIDRTALKAALTGGAR